MQKSLVRDLQFRRTFWLTTISSLLWGGFYLLFYVFIFGSIEQVKGWSQDQCLVLAATFLLINSLFDAVFEQNFKQLPQLVYEGGLDFILIKPVSSQFMVSLGRFSYHKVFRLILMALVAVLIVSRHGDKLSFINITVYLSLLTPSLIIVYALWFSTMCLLFWLGNIANIYMLFHPVFRLNFIPLDIMPPAISHLLFFVIPLMFVSTVPAKALLGIFSWQTVLYGFFISLFFLYLSRMFWRFALRRYTSAA